MTKLENKIKNIIKNKKSGEILKILFLVEVEGFNPLTTVARKNELRIGYKIILAELMRRAQKKCQELLTLKEVNSYLGVITQKGKRTRNPHLKTIYRRCYKYLLWKKEAFK